MNDLIPTGNDTPTLHVTDGVAMADSLDIAAAFGKQHKDVLRAIRNLECSPDFNARNFAPVGYLDGKGEKRTKYGMTRDGFAFLVMGFTGKDAAAWKERYIAAFNTMEREIMMTANEGVTIPPSYPEALRLAAEQAERALAAEAALAEAQDDVFALERIAKADGSLCITDAAKTLQMRPKDLFVWLRANGWIYRRAGNAHDVAYQDKLKSGVLEHKITTVNRTDGSEKVTEQVRVTPKGLERLAKDAVEA